MKVDSSMAVSVQPFINGLLSLLLVTSSLLLVLGNYSSAELMEQAKPIEDAGRSLTAGPGSSSSPFIIDEGDFVASETTTTTTPTTTKTDKVFHGFMSVLSWGFLVPLGAFFGRHKRFFSSGEDLPFVWKSMHIGLPVAAIFVAAIDCGLTMRSFSFSSLHSVLANFIYAMTILQVILGILVIVYKRFRGAHQICGSMLLLAGVLNCFEGIYLSEVGDIRGVFMFFIVFIFIVSIIMDYLPTPSVGSTEKVD